MPITFAACLLLVGGGLIAAQHRLAIGRKAIDVAFSQVDIEMKVRASLISPLLEATGSDATSEAREAADSALRALQAVGTPAAEIAADAPVQIALSRILLLQESYPDLKSNGNFLRLEKQLREAETKLIPAKRKYSEAVTKYNGEISSFPQNLAARIFGFHREESYFDAGSAESGVPKVKF